MFVSTFSRAPAAPALSSAIATPTSLAAGRCAVRGDRRAPAASARGRQPHDAQRHVGRGVQRPLNRRLARRLLVGGALRQLVGGDDLVVGGGVGVDRVGELRRSDCSADARRRRAPRVRSSVPLRVFGRPATIISSDAPIADASAAADPPPGVGSDGANAASRSRRTEMLSSQRSWSACRATIRALLDDRADRSRADADQIDRRAVDDDRVHLLAGLEAADLARADRASTRR